MNNDLQREQQKPDLQVVISVFNSLNHSFFIGKKLLKTVVFPVSRKGYLYNFIHIEQSECDISFIVQDSYLI
jgi:hypothetical protein